MAGRTDLEQLVFQMSADIKQLERANNKALGIVDRDARRIQKRYEQLGTDIGTALGKMSLLAGAAFGALVGYSIKAASDAGELQNAFEKAFGAGSEGAKAFAEDLSKRVGRSVLETQESMMKLRLLLKKQDAGTADAITRQLAERAVDVGSLYNLQDAEVLQKFLSGISGESEPLKSLGVDIGEAAMKAELLKLGFKGVASAAPETAKQVARANIIMRETKIAAGDAAQTIDSTANQAKKLKGEFRDAAAEMGERFLPTATKVITAASDMLGAFNDLPTGVQNAGLAMLGLVAAGGPIIALVSGFANVVKAANAARIAMAAAGVGGLLGAGVATGIGGLAAVTAGQAVAGGVIMAREADRQNFAKNPKSASADQLTAAIAETRKLPLVGNNRGPVMYRAQLKALTDEVARRAKAAPTAPGGVDPTAVAAELAGFKLNDLQKVSTGGSGKAKKDKGRVVILTDADLKTVIEDQVFSVVEDLTSDPRDLDTGPGFTASGDNPYVRTFEEAQNEIRDRTFYALRDGLSAAIYGGWPGLAEYMADSLKMKLIDNLATVLSDMAVKPGGGLISSAISTFAGMFDAGGNIGRGQWGIAGERGAEVVKGPATVVGRVQTAAMMSAAPRATAVQLVAPFHFHAEGSVLTSELLAEGNRQAAAYASSAYSNAVRDSRRGLPAAQATYSAQGMIR